mmetsp:Transcript_2180/g.14431  ORF Transcript_2180/g.14431 Transcript_2180/m.14431 type:complete len:329 (-) Transcript_2180:2792-3778(-)
MWKDDRLVVQDLSTLQVGHPQTRLLEMCHPSAARRGAWKWLRTPAQDQRQTRRIHGPLRETTHGTLGRAVPRSGRQENQRRRRVQLARHGIPNAPSGCTWIDLVWEIRVQVGQRIVRTHGRRMETLHQDRAALSIGTHPGRSPNQRNERNGTSTHNLALQKPHQSKHPGRTATRDDRMLSESHLCRAKGAPTRSQCWEREPTQQRDTYPMPCHEWQSKPHARTESCRSPCSSTGPGASHSKAPSAEWEEAVQNETWQERNGPGQNASMQVGPRTRFARKACSGGSFGGKEGNTNIQTGPPGSGPHTHRGYWTLGPCAKNSGRMYSWQV